MIKIYCKLKSFEKIPVFNAVQSLQSLFSFFEFTFIQVFSLPTSTKKFTVMKSPHKYKKSREQFQYAKVKKCVVAKTNDFKQAFLVMKLVKELDIAGVEIELKILLKDYYIKNEKLI